MERRSWITRLALFATPCLLGSGCDLRSKDWAEQTLGDLPHQTMSVVDPFVDLTLAYNYGTAFSFVSDLADARAVLGVLALVTAVGMLLWGVAKQRPALETVGLGLIAGGAIGNGVDRLFRAAPNGTAVVDFIRVNYPWGGSWPTFNIADVLVAVGVGLILVEAFRDARRARATLETG
ncbi:MAG: signal peptidase II [Sandaracinaceae bacterium]